MLRSAHLQRRLMWLVAAAAVVVAVFDLVNWLPGVAAKLTPVLLAFIIVMLSNNSRRIRRMGQLLEPAGKPTAKTVPRSRKKRQSNPQPEYRSIAWHGFTLRSHSEVKIAKALDHKGLMFLADPKVRLAAESHRQTREVDFLVYHQGRWGILEVDGPHHQNAVQADQWRDARFAQYGLPVMRFPADLCYRQPEVVVETFLEKLASAGPNPSQQT